VVKHVLNNLLAKRRLSTAKAGCYHIGSLEPKSLNLAHKQRLSIVHLWKQWAYIGMEHVANIATAKTHG
jgi:hypothetical protein